MAKDKTVSQYIKENLGINFTGGIPQKGPYQPFEQTKDYAKIILGNINYLWDGIDNLTVFYVPNPKEKKDLLKKLDKLKKSAEQIRKEINFIVSELG